jgi:hypothetical protein
VGVLRPAGLARITEHSKTVPLSHRLGWWPRISRIYDTQKHKTRLGGRVMVPDKPGKICTEHTDLSLTATQRQAETLQVSLMAKLCPNLIP